MKYILISSNEKKYLHHKAFDERGYIDWVCHFNAEVGDIVYIYEKRPTGKILYKAKITKIFAKGEAFPDDSQYWTAGGKDQTYYASLSQKHMRLTLMAKEPKIPVGIDELRVLGYRPPETCLPIDPETDNGARFIEEVDKSFGSDTSRDDDPDEDKTIYHEGSVKLVTSKQYERDPRARAVAIKIHGDHCNICGMEFGKVYGSFAEGFIECHHIVPVSEKAKDYVVDPSKDLIPVCPNCHRMLHHKKPDGTCPTVEELQAIFEKKGDNK